MMAIVGISRLEGNNFLFAEEGPGHLFPQRYVDGRHTRSVTKGEPGAGW